MAWYHAYQVYSNRVSRAVLTAIVSPTGAVNKDSDLNRWVGAMDDYLVRGRRNGTIPGCSVTLPNGNYMEKAPAVFETVAEMAQFQPPTAHSVLVIACRTENLSERCKEALAMGFKTILLEKPGGEGLGDLLEIGEVLKRCNSTSNGNPNEPNAVNVFMGFNRTIQPHIVSGCRYFSLSSKRCLSNDSTHGFHIRLEHNNDFFRVPGPGRPGLQDCFRQNPEGLLKNMAIHEIMVAVKFLGYRADNFKLDIDRGFTELVEVEDEGGRPTGRTDFARVNFVMWPMVPEGSDDGGNNNGGSSGNDNPTKTKITPLCPLVIQADRCGKTMDKSSSYSQLTIVENGKHVGCFCIEDYRGANAKIGVASDPTIESATGKSLPNPLTELNRNPDLLKTELRAHLRELDPTETIFGGELVSNPNSDKFLDNIIPSYLLEQDSDYLALKQAAVDCATLPGGNRAVDPNVCTLEDGVQCMWLAETLDGLIRKRMEGGCTVRGSAAAASAGPGTAGTGKKASGKVSGKTSSSTNESSKPQKAQGENSKKFKIQSDGNVVPAEIYEPQTRSAKPRVISDGFRFGTGEEKESNVPNQNQTPNVNQNQMPQMPISPQKTMPLSPPLRDGPPPGPGPYGNGRVLNSAAANGANDYAVFPPNQMATGNGTTGNGLSFNAAAVTNAFKSNPGPDTPSRPSAAQTQPLPNKTSLASNASLRSSLSVRVGAPQDDSKIVRIAIVGAGRMGALRAAHIFASPNTELTCIIENFNVQKAEEMASKYRCVGGVFPNLRECEKSWLSRTDETMYDAVWVCTPTHTHKLVIEQICEVQKERERRVVEGEEKRRPKGGSDAFNNGDGNGYDLPCLPKRHKLSVFTEKPVDGSPAEIKRLFDLCSRNDIMLCCGFQRRFDPAYKSLRRNFNNRDYFGTPLFATVYFYDHPRPPDSFLLNGGGGCPFLDLVPHDADLLYWLMNGENPVEFWAHSSYSSQQLEQQGVADNATLTARYKSGFVVHFCLSRGCSYGYDNRIEVFGSKGTRLCVKTPSEERTVIREDIEGYNGGRQEFSFPERFSTAFRNEVELFAECCLRERTGYFGQSPPGSPVAGYASSSSESEGKNGKTNNPQWPVGSRECEAAQLFAMAGALSAKEKRVVTWEEVVGRAYKM